MLYLYRQQTFHHLLTLLITILFFIQSVFWTASLAHATEELPLETQSGVITDQNEIPDEPNTIPTAIEIITGDAGAITELESVVNTNLTSTEASTTPELATEENDEELEPETLSSEDLATSTLEGVSPVIASSTNLGVVENYATTTADTGDNTIVAGDLETTTIITGDAFAVANVVNLVNTNILNSAGLIQFFTTLGLPVLDVRNLFSVFSTEMPLSTVPCADSVCGETGIVNESTTDNIATITNNIVVRSGTGGNSTSGGGESLITTGDAYATANIFNLANTNITDSNYMLIAVNNLGNLDGDIVLPNADLLNQLFSLTGGVQNTAVENNNTAIIENNLGTGADTGGNVSDGGTIETGTAVSSANVTNHVNQNLIGSDSFLLLLRVHGNWSGDIFGLPESMMWSESPNGITIYNAPADSSPGEASGYQIENNNQATIQNNVSVFALTGENKVEGSGTSSISTGKAYASASIANLANLNILSQNWALLIFDIFGDWSGNIAFGRPDLWVGVKATSPDSPIMPGSIVNYTYTVSNLGDTKATNVTLENVFNTAALQFPEGIIEPLPENKTRTSWQLGVIQPGATREVTYQARVGDTLPRGTKTTVPLTVNVFAKENEDQKENNTDSIAIEVGNVVRAAGGGGSSGSSKAANLVVSKQAVLSSTTAPAMIDYEISIENTGGPLYNAVLFDTLESDAGEIMHEEFWDLGTIAARESIKVNYTVSYATSTKPGIYTNTAQVIGNDRKTKPTSSNLYKSAPKSVSVEIIGQEGEVLGASTTCEEYLKSYLRFGQQNEDSEVLKLQTFLAEHMSAKIIPTGKFDLLTLSAVMAFQNRYKEEILIPWGLKEPSGYVYLTTRKAINEIKCGRAVAFPLTPEQKLEIAQKGSPSDKQLTNI